MHSKIESLISRIRELECQLEDEIEARRSKFKYKIKKKRVHFENEMVSRHRRLKINIWNYIAGANILVVLTAPVIYSMIFPLIILDVFVTIYQASCFPIYKLKRVRRSDYIAIDRHKLHYLNGIEKLNCIYCGYSNGLIAYVAEIASCTEQYWCPIKHSRRVMGAHRRYPEFIEFGDADAYHENQLDLRHDLNKKKQS